MKAWDIVGYAYEADTHCCDCARARFGATLDSAKDCEGNQVHPIFASSEDCAGDVCGDCFAPLMEEL